MLEAKTHVAIIGGGLVGSLNACFLAIRGFDVELFEMRPDIRSSEAVQGRSINLALSYRGLEALDRVDLKAEVLENVIPMYARMIHDPDGKQHPIPYGTNNQSINSIDRRLLNEILLNKAETYPNVTLHFKHKFVSADFTTGALSMLDPDGVQFTKTFDLIIGTDGAYSAVRRSVAKQTRFNFSQQYIEHGYMELTFYPGHDGKHTMATNFLHIWPRNEFMMIGLPNKDGSFTGTLFMPFYKFEMLKTEEDLLDFFQKVYPDSVPLLGKKNLVKTFFASKPSPLLTVKCHPYHVGSRGLLMGDAAHAMVPFYGQGMNCVRPCRDLPKPEMQMPRPFVIWRSIITSK